MTSLPPFKLERYFAQYEFTTRYLLCSSDCEAQTISEVLALEPDAAEAFQTHWLGYTESAGAPTLRQAICQIYTTLSPEQVLVHTGAEEAIFLLMHACLQAGDHVIVHAPCYQSLHEVARSLGCMVSDWEARETQGWALDIDDLKRLVRPNTKLIVLNTPHNPTGYLMPRAGFLAVNAFAQERGLLLFSDEVYRESEYALADRLPSACDVSETAVALGVLSKTYGLAGLRIGWLASHNTAALRRVAALKDYTTICNSAPSEFLAEVALRQRATLIQRNLGLIQHNLTLLDAFFARWADRVQWARPSAGSMAFPRLLTEEVEVFCHATVTEAGVLLLPGTMYNWPGPNFRLGFGRRNMPEALERLDDFLRQRWGK